MKDFNMFNACPGSHVARFDLLEMARVIHAPTGRVACQHAERENGEEEKVGHVVRFNRLSGFLSS